MNKFKVGDVVRYVNGENFQGDGKTATITGVGTEVYHLSNGFTLMKYSAEVGGTGGTIELAYPNPPHKHAEIIKAWADGAEVEMKSKMRNVWDKFMARDLACCKEYEMRIKPNKSPAEAEKESIVAEMEKLKKRLDDLEV